MEINEAWLRRASSSFDCLYSFTISLTINRTIIKLNQSGQLTTGTWKHIKSRMFGHAIVEWCEVFGADSEHTHWKQLIQEDQEFRKGIYSATGFEHRQWSDYRQSLCDFRNQLVAHSLEKSPKIAPNLEPALQVVKECHSWLVKALSPFPSVLYKGPASLDDFINNIETEFISENATPHVT